MIGSTLTVQEQEEQYREQCAEYIANAAAELVAAKDMSREDAIRTVTEYLRNSSEAMGDVTGVLDVENVETTPSRKTPRHQNAAIAKELWEAALEAADSL